MRLAQLEVLFWVCLGIRRLTTAASVRAAGRLQPGTQHVSPMSTSVTSQTNRAPAILLFPATTPRGLSTAAPAPPVTHFIDWLCLL